MRAQSERSSQEPDIKKDTLLESGHRGYIAGVLDCDGSIWISADKSGKGKYVKYALRISVSNTCVALPEWFVKYFGGKATTYVRRSVKWKDEHRWACSGLPAARVIRICLPYLVVKHAQGLLALEFASTIMPGCSRLPDSYHEMRERLYLKMLELNKRGPK